MAIALGEASFFCAQLRAPDSLFLQYFLTDALFSCPRLRFSRAQKRAILSWGKKLGAKDVPSLEALSRLQQRIHKSVGDPTRKHVGRTTGSIFYLNEVKRAIAMVRLFRLMCCKANGHSGIARVLYITTFLATIII